jgi:hypothetical protein
MHHIAMLDVWQMSFFFGMKATDEKWTQLSLAEEC